ncbi:polysaccharide pyruvyl transferase family protein, partial [Deinococcus pimensis]|uniref:polysaccharide pyruvyl transferase family protein n=1 Tax=Deinococcus pimensis TaxID=309888 RepID=UPI0005EAE79E
LADRLRAEGREVVALSFQPHEDDEEARLVSNDVVSTADPQVALDTIRSAGFVVGVRLHAVILAAAAGVPFAGVSYDPKVRGFCEDAGAPVV